MSVIKTDSQIDEIKLPENYGERPAHEKAAIDANNAALAASFQSQIAKMESMLEFLDKMEFEEQELYDLESLRLRAAPAR